VNLAQDGRSLVGLERRHGFHHRLGELAEIATAEMQAHVADADVHLLIRTDGDVGMGVSGARVRGRPGMGISGFHGVLLSMR
jgi:hypothetical protein